MITSSLKDIINEHGIRTKKFHEEQKDKPNKYKV